MGKCGAKLTFDAAQMASAMFCLFVHVYDHWRSVNLHRPIRHRHSKLANTKGRISEMSLLPCRPCSPYSLLLAGKQSHNIGKTKWSHAQEGFGFFL
jgi:hypothetical protein